MMWKNKLWIGCCLFFGAVQLSAQPLLRIEGKIAGAVQSELRLETIAGEEIATVKPERGRFVLEKELAAGLYRLQIGVYQREVFLSPDTVFIEGYIDPDHKAACQVSYRGLALHERLMGIVEEIERSLEVKQEGPQDEWIALWSLEDERRVEAALQYMRREQMPEFAAALAWCCRGNYYDSAARLYAALNEQGQESVCGKMLKNFMEENKGMANGQPAPDFVVIDAGGQQLKPGQFRGKVMVIDFWASWCGPCRAEMKYLRKLYTELQGKPVVFLSISLDDSREKWEQAAAEEQIPWLSAWESKGFKQSELRQKYHFDGIPFLVVLDAEGRIAGKALRRNALRKCLLELLN